MEIGLKKLVKFAEGYERYKLNKSGLTFYRFTKSECEYYKDSELIIKTFSVAGIKLRFTTDGDKLSFSGEFRSASSRPFYSMAVATDGGYSEYKERNQQEDGGKFSFSFSLPKGDKTITVYMPWSVGLTVKTATVDNATYIKPAYKRKTRAVFYGDSITQGYDAKDPSKPYFMQVSDFLDADSVNKAVAGEVFCPDFLAKSKRYKRAEFVFVAFGTNDFTKSLKSNFVKSANKFFENVVKLYKRSEIFALLPVWRKDMDEKYGMTFDFVRETIISAVKDKPIALIDCLPFVPHDEKYYPDGYLHPGDDGFKFYSNCLIGEIKKAVK